MGWKLLPRALEGDLIATSGGDVIDLGWCETKGKERESQPLRVMRAREDLDPH